MGARVWGASGVPQQGTAPKSWWGPSSGTSEALGPLVLYPHPLKGGCCGSAAATFWGSPCPFSSCKIFLGPPPSPIVLPRGEPTCFPAWQGLSPPALLPLSGARCKPRPESQGLEKRFLSQVSPSGVRRVGRWLEVGFGIGGSSFPCPGLRDDCGCSSGASVPAVGRNHRLRHGQAAPGCE